MTYYILFIISILSIPLYFYYKNFLDKGETICIFIAAITHISISMIDPGFSPILSSIVDSQYYFNSALWFIESNQWNTAFDTGAVFYSALLAIIFKITTPDILLSNLSSTFFSILTCILFARFLKLLNIQKTNSLILLVLFSFFPATLIFGSITLREPLQLLTLMASLFYLIKIYRNNYMSLIEHIVFFISIILLGLLHYALMYVSGLILCIYIYQNILTHTFYSKTSILLSAFILFFITINIISYSRYIDNSNKTSGIRISASAIEIDRVRLAEFVIDNVNLVKLMEKINQYRIRAETDFIGNTNYYILFDTSTIFSSIKSFVQIYTTYIFKPYIYEIYNLSSFYAAAESFIRISLILLVLITLISKRRLTNYTLTLILVFFTISIMWSLGTFNFGQAVRHHILTNWMLILLAGISIKELKSNKEFI